MLNPAFLIGMLGQVDWTQDSTEALVTSANGRGWMVGPYMAARLTPNLTLNARADWGKADNIVNPLGAY